MQGSERVEQAGDDLTVAFVVCIGESKQSTGVRMNEDYDGGGRLGQVNSLFEVFAWPRDGVALPALASGIWNKNDLSNQKAPPRTWCTRADQDGGCFQAIWRKEVALHLSMQGTAEGQSCFGDHSPTSLASAAATIASWVTTLSVAGLQGAPGPRFRD